MPLGEAVTTIAGIAAIALILIAVLRLFATLMTQRTIRKAIETKPELTGEVLDKLTAKTESSGEDRLAIVLIAIGIAMIVAPLIAVDDTGLIRAAIGAATFPLLVGGALWLRFRAVRRASRRDDGQ